MVLPLKGDLVLQSKLISEQYDAWEKELEADKTPAAEVLRQRIHSFSSKNGKQPQSPYKETKEIKK